MTGCHTVPDLVQDAVRVLLPTQFGEFEVTAVEVRPGLVYLALARGDLTTAGPVLTRVHSECLTGEAFGSLKCECGPQLDAALDTIRDHGGVVVYLRGHEGRGIGLINKLRAYRLQEDGLDTLDANLALGLPADSRQYGAAADMLRDLGITSVRLLSNNPDKADQLGRLGVTVAERVPTRVHRSPANARYLATKAVRGAHTFEPS